MRAKMQMKRPNEEWTQPGYANEGSLATDLEQMLAWESLDFVDIHHKSGMITRYWHWEYECLWCGSYDHESDNCPDLDDSDDADDDAIE